MNADGKVVYAAGQPSEAAAGNEHRYEIDSIVGHQYDNDQQVWFQVCWVGHPQAEDYTWLHSQDFVSSRLIDAYWARVASARATAAAAMEAEKNKDKAGVLCEFFSFLYSILHNPCVFSCLVIFLGLILISRLAWLFPCASS